MAIDRMFVSIADPYALQAAERAALLERLRRHNFVFYRLDGERHQDKQAIRALNAELGLFTLDGNPRADEDRMTSLQLSTAGAAEEFIPYTERALNWHTDGYYNPPERRIRAFTMHCVRPAATGGENAWLDHALLHRLLCEQDARAAEVLAQVDVMTIPAHVQDGRCLRPAMSGPVFWRDTASGALYMRYTARKRYIEWRDSPAVRQAVTALERVLAQAEPLVLRYRLAAGEGVICNNVLHARTAFSVAPAAGRLLYRARYHERVAGT